MNKLQIIKELMGEDTAPFIANDLKYTYMSLKEDLEDIKEYGHAKGIFSWDAKEDKREIKKMMKSIKEVYKWYSSDNLE